jgi:hypothetical protein
MIQKSLLGLYFQDDQQLQHLALRHQILSGLVQTQLAVSARCDAVNREVNHNSASAQVAEC